MQDVVVADLLMRIEMEPALPPLALWARIPGKRQRLNAPVGKLDEILLQGIEAEGVFDLEGCELAVRAVGLDHELVAIAEEARVHAEIVEACIVEVADHSPCWHAPWRAHAAIRARASPPRYGMTAQVSLPTKLSACTELPACGGVAGDS